MVFHLQVLIFFAIFCFAFFSTAKTLFEPSVTTGMDGQEITSSLEKRLSEMEEKIVKLQSNNKGLIARLTRMESDMKSEFLGSQIKENLTRHMIVTHIAARREENKLFRESISTSLLTLRQHVDEGMKVFGDRENKHDSDISDMQNTLDAVKKQLFDFQTYQRDVDEAIRQNLTSFGNLRQQVNESLSGLEIGQSSLRTKMSDHGILLSKLEKEYANTSHVLRLDRSLQNLDEATKSGLKSIRDAVEQLEKRGDVRDAEATEMQKLLKNHTSEIGATSTELFDFQTSRRAVDEAIRQNLSSSVENLKKHVNERILEIENVHSVFRQEMSNHGILLSKLEKECANTSHVLRLDRSLQNLDEATKAGLQSIRDAVEQLEKRGDVRDAEATEMQKLLKNHTSEIGATSAQLFDIQNSCSAPPTIGNGHHESGDRPSDRKHGAIVTYTCQAGRTLVGSGDLVCSFGQWRGVLPQCANKCNTQDLKVYDGLYFPINWAVEHSKTLGVRCRKGYVISSTSASLTCNDGIWHVTADPCIKAPCAGNPPSLRNGKVKTFERKHGSSIRYECDRNFVMTVNSSVICESGKWKGHPPACNFLDTTFYAEASYNYGRMYVECYSDSNADKIEFSRVLDTGTGGGLPSAATLSSSPRSVRMDLGDVRSPDWFGAYRCGFKTEEGSADVVVAFQAREGLYFPHPRKMVNVGDSVTLYLDKYRPPSGIRWSHDGIRVPWLNGRMQLFIPEAKVNDTGTYSARYHDETYDKAIMRLVVRRCRVNLYGERCNQVCLPCYNGGVCHDLLGVCVCPEGFVGSNCEIPCKEGFHGADCRKRCVNRDCEGRFFCKPNPFGCSCARGYEGTRCQKECEPGSYGASCKQPCHCAGGNPCNRFTGACSGGCARGWKGESCQIEVFDMPPCCNGRIHEVYRNGSEINYLWKIPRFLSSNSPVMSTSISWLGTSWCLHIYTNGRPISRSVGWAELLITTDSPPSKPCRMTIGIQKADETERVLFRDRKFGNIDRLHNSFNLLRRSELLKCSSQLTHKGALIITFFICSVETPLPGENPSPSTDLGVVGDIKETRHDSDKIVLEWRIPKLFSLSNEKGGYYSSSDVEFINTRWRLIIYLNGHSAEGSGDWVELDVLKSDSSNCKKHVRLTLGIKKAGAKDTMIFKEQIIPDHRSLWSGEKFIERKQLLRPKRRLLFLGALTIICTLRVDETYSVPVTVSTPDTIECFRENFRSRNKIDYEWKIPEFSSLLKSGDCYLSPTVDFLDTTWRLKIYPFGRKAEEAYGWMGVDVWKVDWSSSQTSVYLTLGIKKGDSTEMIFVNQQILKHRRLWRTSKFIHRSELSRRKDILLPSDVLTIDFSLRVEEASPATTGSSVISRPLNRIFEICREGIVRERECNYHKEVEWDITLPLDAISPIFLFGSQSYWLSWKEESIKGDTSLNLYSSGPPTGLSQSALWWAGLRRPDGTPLFNNTCGVLDLEQEDRKWEQSCLYVVKPTDVALELGGKEFTVFLRINVERTPKEAEMCSHVYPGVSEISSYQERKTKRSKCSVQTLNWDDYGTIHYEICPHHNQVEWFIPGEVQRVLHSQYAHRHVLRIMSPEFSFDTHKFKIEWTAWNKTDDYTLNVYSCDDFPFSFGRWWLAMKYTDGTYHLVTLRGEMKPENGCELWTLRGSHVFDYMQMSKERVYIIFRYSREEASPRTNLCIHGDMDMPVRSVGSLREEVFPSHMQVEWSVEHELSERLGQSVVSPLFVMGRQRYVLEFNRDYNQGLVLYLYRQEIPVAETESYQFVRWWVGWRRGDGTYYYKNRRGTLDLKEESEVWRQIFLHRVSGEELKEKLLTPDSRICLFLRLSEDRTDTNEGEKILSDPKQQEAEEDSEIVFRVKGVEFKISRAILGDRFPVLNAMFQYDTMEKRTGVVNIEDSEPAIIEEFLHYVSCGFLRQLTDYNAFALYTVADKYLMDDLKIETLQAIYDNMSIHNFCDAFVLAVTYGEEDLLKLAIDFFSKNNKSIMKSDDWPKFQKDNRAIAYRLLSVLFKRPQTFKDNLFKSFTKNKKSG